jgi:hypothetical protein
MCVAMFLVCSRSSPLRVFNFNPIHDLFDGNALSNETFLSCCVILPVLNSNVTMKNVIVSLDNLPNEVQQAIDETYPEGFKEDVFDFRMPTNNEVYEALRFTWGTVNYIIKVAKKKIDQMHGMDPGLL